MDEEEREFQRRYGAWAPLRPDEVAAYLSGFDAPWWITGGWAIEAFSGVSRHHDDVDVSILHRDLDGLRSALEGRVHLWSVGSGMLRPLDDQWPDLHPESAQVWTREHALAPWRADIQVNPDQGGLWVNRRWPDHVAALDEVTWVGDDGIRYLRPEIALLFKAKLHRPKDDLDLEAALPLLSDVQRRWLSHALEAVHPGHPWSSLVIPGHPWSERASGYRTPMSDDQSITVERTIDASTKKIFDVLTNPERHAEIDASGFVLSDEKSDRITGTGQTFRMNMTGDHMGGDYQTDNTVSGYDENHLVAWQTAPAGNEPPGWEWTWELKSQGSDATDVTLTYDWSKVTDPEILKQVSFPLVDRAALEQSLDNLAAAVSG